MPRLTGHEINILRSIIRRSGGRPVTLSRFHRRLVAPLWRRGLIEAWYRQAPENTPSLQGPLFTLSIAGARLAACFAQPRSSEPHGR